MKKKIFAAIIIPGIAIVAYWLISPLFIDKQVNEKTEDIAVTDEAQQQAPILSVISSGNFGGLANHEAEGTAKLIKADGKYFIRFEDDFKSSNGPDVHVYLGKSNNYDPDAELGVLKGNIGGQNYQIPDAINVSDYDEVWIWCRAFAVPFGKAELK